MNRGYTRDDYLRLVDQVRQAVPEISLTTDLIVGFPEKRIKTSRILSASCGKWALIQPSPSSIHRGRVPLRRDCPIRFRKTSRKNGSMN